MKPSPHLEFSAPELDSSSVEKTLRSLGFREEVIEYIGTACRQLSRSGEMPRFLEFCRCWRAGRECLFATPASWEALAVVAAFPGTIEKHRQRGVPEGITRATLLDLQRRMEEFRSREGVWGFDRLKWMRNHVSGEFFEFGRLQYALGTFAYPFRVYRDIATGTVVPLALPGLRCDADGWPVDSAESFETILEVREDGILGHRTSSCDGSIARTPILITRASTILLDERSSVAHVHIPAGAKLDTGECRASLEAAQAFFQRCFPERNLRAFCSASWLLDAELGRALPPSSNIVAFGRLFRLLARRNGDDQQLLERVFPGETHWENCKATTSLQRAVLEHRRSGARFRNTAGFILFADIASPEAVSNDTGRPAV